MKMNRRQKRIGFLTIGALASVLIGGAVMHTPFGLRLLATAGVGCPATAVDQGTAAELRAEGWRTLRGKAPSPDRFALGLDLTRSREADVTAWAAARGAACTRRQRGFVLLTCTRAIGRDIEETTLAFDAKGGLLSVDLVRQLGDPGDAVRIFRDRSTLLTGALGEPTDRGGDAVEVALASTPHAAAVLRYRFTDYVAVLAMVRLPSGLTVREEYHAPS